MPPGPAQCAACSAPQCTTTPSTTILSSIARFMDWCRFPVPLIPAAFWVTTHGVIYLKTVDSIALLGLLATCNCRGVFPLCVPKNPTVHQGLSHCGMQICINIFVRREKRERGEGGEGKKRETASPDASQLHWANEHKCHCQAEMKKKCVTAANCAGVGGQQDMFCIWRGECPRRESQTLHL